MDSKPTSNDPLLGNSLSGLMGCALGTTVSGTPVTFSFWMNCNTRANHGEHDNYLGVDNYWPGTVWRSLPNDGNQGSCHVAGFICEWAASQANAIQKTAVPTGVTQLQVGLGDQVTVPNTTNQS